MKILQLLLSLFGFTNNSQTEKQKQAINKMHELLYLNGVEARNQGMNAAEDSANRASKGWSNAAYAFLLGYAQNHNEFMIEQVRAASIGTVPTPPSNRAWGSIAMRAAKDGFISRKGFKSVSNVKAHRTPATLWTVNK